MLALKETPTRSEPFDFISYLERGQTLLVGEGNLSFALSLALRMKAWRRNLVATTYEPERRLSEVTSANATRLRRLGVRVLHAIDATKLDAIFEHRRFGLIVFQFPNVASREPLHGRNPNYILVRRFLRSARSILLRNGRIAITAIDSPFYDGAFAMSEAAKWAAFSEPDVHPFKFSDHPSYSHANTLDDAESAITSKDKCQTYVFSKND
jgi:hypothetical protein